jgi:subtilisin-like proprotein convertase family protein
VFLNKILPKNDKKRRVCELFGYLWLAHGNKTKTHEKAMANKYILTIASLFYMIGASAQTITITGTGNLLIPPGAPGQTVGVTESPATVAGIGTLGGCVTIDHVTIDLQHTFVGDIGILLIGPGGQFIDLSTANGGGGDNYTNTVFSDNAGQFITTGSPPFTGTFRPEGRATTLNNPYSNALPLGTATFANTFNGTNADGVWRLYINDYVPVDIGLLISWSITFSIGGNVNANAGADATICTGASTTLAASGGATYLWSTGATSSSISVSPVATTTYTVTVTDPVCGTDTDEVVITVQPRPSVTFTAATTEVCPGNCVALTANLVGTAPFTMVYNLVGAGGGFSTITLTFGSNSQVFFVCTLLSTPPGDLQIQTTSLTDAFCTCN